ncbi:lysozyme-like [Neocloeon triangulifer]|uniref:lysozyme-like n=1 Tax=Neocloeon triangulifer TaxID=2078957 RepID=UPI00286F8ED8|nr:lysozyme-like [Neocloeon triangulifer]
MFRVIVFVAVFAIFAASLELPNTGFEAEMSIECLGCVCEATTRCNLNYNCTQGLCGPMLISEPYWFDAGRPVIDGDNTNWSGAFHRCVTDPVCAGATVRKYMAKYRQDCNGDGRIDCDDFGRLHYYGGYKCQKRIEGTQYWRQFMECRAATNQLGGQFR